MKFFAGRFREKPIQENPLSLFRTSQAGVERCLRHPLGEDPELLVIYQMHADPQPSAAI